MRFFRLLTCIALIFNAFTAIAKEEEADKQPRILILLDGSSSMLKEWTNDEFRFEAASDIIGRLMDSVYSVNKNVEFALRVYGHQNPTADNNCFDSKKEVSFSKDNYAQIALRLAALHPLGVSPIAYSLEQSAINDMVNLRENKYSLILITDGGESCDGDICKVFDELLKKKIDFKPYILSLVDYAPLKTQYACLGDYLLVASPEQIDPVVGKIVDAYKRDFIQPRAIKKLVTSASANAPSALKVKTPTFKVPDPKPEDPKPVLAKQPEPTPTPPTPTPPQQPSNIVVQNEIKEREKETVTTITPNNTKQKLPQRYGTRSFDTKKLDNYVPPTPEVEKTSVKQQEPVFKPMPTTKATVATTTPPPVPTPTKPVTYSVERTKAAETSLELYFGNGRGKYYETAPEIVLSDPRTGKEVHKFQRTVDAYGNPRPQMDIPPGVYDLTITNKNGFVAQNIEVLEGEKNIYKLVVPDATLVFQYENNNDRPVKEFAARVSKALVRGPVTKQYCTEQLQYEPGNYHISINTNPISHRNVDLDFGVVVYLGIDEPGKITVVNPSSFSKIQFQYQHGALFETFRPIDVTGNIQKQEFLIQPGRYKVIYVKDIRSPQSSTVTKNFIIKSNTITEIVLD